ncbi:hypothetical protein D3C81_2063420 [compost metagenome]
MKFLFSAGCFHSEEKITLNGSQAVIDKTAVGIMQLHAVLCKLFMKQAVDQSDHCAFGQAEQHAHNMIQLDLSVFLSPFSLFAHKLFFPPLYHNSALRLPVPCLLNIKKRRPLP